MALQHDYEGALLRQSMWTQMGVHEEELVWLNERVRLLKDTSGHARIETTLEVSSEPKAGLQQISAPKGE